MRNTPKRCAAFAAVAALALSDAAHANSTPSVTQQPNLNAAVAPYALDPSGADPVLSNNEMIRLIRQKVKYVFVIFNENNAFDHEYGTFPGVNGLYSDGRSPRAPANTPGFTQTYTDVNGAVATVQPIRIGPEQNATFVDSVDHSHKGLARKLDVVYGQPRMDGFSQTEYSKYAGSSAASPEQQAQGKQFARLVMSYVDCDTIPFFWRYANRFTIFDNIFATEDTPSTPNAIAMIAGQSGETQWVKHGPKATPNQPIGGIVNGKSYSGVSTPSGVPVVNDPQPFWGSAFDATNDRPPAERLQGILGAQQHRREPDLRDRPADARRRRRQDADVGRPRAGDGSGRHPERHSLYRRQRRGGGQLALVSERLQRQRAQRARLRHGGRPSELRVAPQRPAIFRLSRQQPQRDAEPQGRRRFLHRHRQQQFAEGRRRHLCARRLLQHRQPNAADPERQIIPIPTGLTAEEIKTINAAKSGDDDHPSYSDHQISESMAARVVNAVAANPTLWSQSAIVMTYDESDGFYDHVPPRILSYGPDDLPLARGIRIPLLLISPYARAGAVSHAEGDHNAVIETISAIFGLPALSSLPDEMEALQAGDTEAFNRLARAHGPANFEQKFLGPRDRNTDITDSLLSGFSPMRLKGLAAPLPADYATIPEADITALPHYGGKGCAAIGVTPTDADRPHTIPAGLNTLPATLPKYN